MREDDGRDGSENAVDLAAHSGNNPSPIGSALLPAAPIAPLAAALTDVTAAATYIDACLHERTTSSTSKSGQHCLSPKKKKRKHSHDCPKGTARSVFLHKQELDGKIPCRQDPQLAADDAAVNTSKRPDIAVKFFRTEQETPWLRVVGVAVLLLVRESKGVRSRLSSRSRHLRVLYFPHRRQLVAFDHRTLDEALSAACRQEGEMEQYLEEKKASQKRHRSVQESSAERQPQQRQLQEDQEGLEPQLECLP
ncbi:hypothetical protein Taro_014103 [Colocasia esculenta]|uniref:Uncharacterized protein n=1 Tax=Colocasia esculenta TaxID=4460 RepID=A0A843UI02_COLES|nr:hypothetical protein [Colocasia esculenta]